MIVQNGSLTAVVNDIPSALDSIAKIAAAHEGYVVSSTSWKSDERVFGAISIRIPAEDFDTAMLQITQLAVEVTSQNTSSTDVTEEYVDLIARLSSLEATEQQLLLIMSKADKVADILAVQEQLTQIQSQIEQIKGRMQYLEKTSATSLIQINLEQAKLEVKFTANRTNAKTGEEVQFNPDVAGGFTPYSYAWDFGDGKTGTDQSPLHKYAKPGEYTITLKVTDDRSNTAEQTRLDYITVTQGGWSIGGVLSGAWQALLWLGRALVTLLITLGVFSPVWLIIILLIWLARRQKKSIAK
jgi:PKD repeat protein